MAFTREPALPDRFGRRLTWIEKLRLFSKGAETQGPTDITKLNLDQK